MSLLSRTRRCCLMAAYGCALLMRTGSAACANGHRPLPIDPALTNGLATVKFATGFIENPSGHEPIRWQPNLQVLVGVKATEGSKQTVRFVALTTLPPPAANAAGQPWSPPL